MENKTLPEIAKSSKGSIIAATIVGLAVVGGAASSLVDKPESDKPIQYPVVNESRLSEDVDQENLEEDISLPEPVVMPAAAPKPVVVPTPAPKPRNTCSCPVNDLDCSDFSSGPDAQAVYECCLKQGRGDYHRLDRDKDGTACDTLW